MAMNNDKMHVKSEFGDDIRRFLLPQETTLDTLRGVMSDSYKMGETEFLLKYRDDEGDLVTLASEEDLVTAKEISEKVLRVVVVVKATAAPSGAEETGSATDEGNQETCAVPFTLRNGQVVTIHLFVQALARFGMENLSPEELTTETNKWSLRALVKMGVVSRREVISLCRENSVRVPKFALKESKGMKEPRGIKFFGRGRGRGRGRGACRGRGAGHQPYNWRQHVVGQSDHDDHHPGHHGQHHRHHHHGHHHHGQHHGSKVSDEEITANLEATRLENTDPMIDANDDANNHVNNRQTITRFIKHVTLPDKTVVTGGSRLTKTWRLRNDSDQPWPENCELVAVGGDCPDFGWKMGSAKPIRGGVLPHHEVDVSVDIFTPERAGHYQGYWKLREVGGAKFGNRVWVSVTVPASSSDSAEDSGFVPVPLAVQNNATETHVSEVALQQLADMGFEDREENMRLLIKYHGNMERAVSKLSDKSRNGM